MTIIYISDMGKSVLASLAGSENYSTEMGILRNLSDGNEWGWDQLRHKLKLKRKHFNEAMINLRKEGSVKVIEDFRSFFGKLFNTRNQVGEIERNCLNHDILHLNAMDHKIPYLSIDVQATYADNKLISGLKNDPLLEESTLNGLAQWVDAPYHINATGIGNMAYVALNASDKGVRKAHVDFLNKYKGWHTKYMTDYSEKKSQFAEKMRKTFIETAKKHLEDKIIHYPFVSGIGTMFGNPDYIEVAVIHPKYIKQIKKFAPNGKYMGYRVNIVVRQFAKPL